MTTLQRMTLYAFIAGIGYLVLYCFLAGEFGVWLMLFLIGAGLFNLPYELMTGRRTPRKPWDNDEGGLQPRDGLSPSMHTRMHNPQHAFHPENDMHRLYMDD